MGWLALVSAIKRFGAGLIALLPSIFGFIWRYKAYLLIGILTTLCFVLYGKYKDEQQAHKDTIVRKDKEYANMESTYLLAVIAQQQKAAQVAENLAESLKTIEENQIERNKEIDRMSSAISSNANRLQQNIKEYSGGSTNTINESSSAGYAERLRIIGGISEECISEYSKMGEYAAREQQAKITLQDSWREVQEKINAE